MKEKKRSLLGPSGVLGGLAGGAMGTGLGVFDGAVQASTDAVMGAKRKPMALLKFLAKQGGRGGTIGVAAGVPLGIAAWLLSEK